MKCNKATMREQTERECTGKYICSIQDHIDNKNEYFGATVKDGERCGRRKRGGGWGGGGKDMETS